jgi:hypothetical protein
MLTGPMMMTKNLTPGGPRASVHLHLHGIDDDVWSTSISILSQVQSCRYSPQDNEMEEGSKFISTLCANVL